MSILRTAAWIFGVIVTGAAVTWVLSAIVSRFPARASRDEAMSVPPIDILGAIERGFCPYHPTSPVDGSECGCTWLPPVKPITTAELDALDRNIWHGTPLPEVPADLRQAEIAELDRSADWQWTVQSITSFTATPPEETRANLKAAFAEPQPGSDRPEVRYWVTRPSIGWQEHEVTKGVYMRLEAEFGFRTEVGPEPVTRWFCDRFMVSAWTTRGGDRGDAPTSLAHHRDCRAAWVEPVDTIAAAKLDEMAARMAQPGMTRQRPIGDDPNDEVTAPLPHRTPGALLPAEFVTDCGDLSDGDDCGGCSCHMNPPCHHCTDHVRDAETELTDLPQWAGTADHGPRTVSHWDQPAKPINGSAL